MRDLNGEKIPKFYSKASSEGGGGGRGYRIKRPGGLEKMYNAAYCFYIYPDGSVEVAKNCWEDVKGFVDIDQVVPILSKVIADLKLQDTKLDMFKEGLSKLLQEAIENTLKGDYYERAIRAESRGDGSDCSGSP